MVGSEQGIMSLRIEEELMPAWAGVRARCCHNAVCLPCSLFTQMFEGYV